MAIIWGTSDDDTLYGSMGDDFIYCGSGDDTAYAEAGDDVVFGGFGNDMLFGGDGDDWLYGDHGGGDAAGGGNEERNDVLAGGKGNDWIIADSPDRQFKGDVVQPPQDCEIENGVTGQDGRAGDNPVIGGNDQIFAGAGDDYIDAGPGNDIIGGDSDYMPSSPGLLDDGNNYNGNDIIVSGDGNDLSYGGGGNDRMYDGGGDDLLDGGRGDDTISNSSSAPYTPFNHGAHDRLLGGQGDDEIASFISMQPHTTAGIWARQYLYGDHIDPLNPGEYGNDTLFLGFEDGGPGVGWSGSTIEFQIHGDSPESMEEGGNDVIEVASGSDGGNSPLRTNSLITGGGGNDEIKSYLSWGVEVHGGFGDDVIVCIESDLYNSAGDGLFGDEGSDILSGGSGSDGLFSGGINRLTHRLDDGYDVMTGGTGADHFYWAGVNGRVTDHEIGLDKMIVLGDRIVAQLTGAEGEIQLNYLGAGQTQVLVQLGAWAGWGVEDISVQATTSQALTAGDFIF